MDYVYVVEGLVDYESSSVIGVYTTKPKAAEAVLKCVATSGAPRGCCHDRHEINRIKVDK